MIDDDAEAMKLRTERAEASIAALAPYAAIGLAALDHWRQGWDMDGETLHEAMLGAGVLVDDADKGEHAPGEDAAREAITAHFYGQGLAIERPSQAEAGET